MRTASLLAVVIGSGAGVLFALASRSTPPPVAPPSSTTSVTSASPATSVAGASDQLAPSQVPAPATLASASATPDASAEGSSDTGPTAITDPSELERAAIACDNKDRIACRKAAEAYETGQIVPANEKTARRLRRVELTLLVRECEAENVAACFTLSGYYARGIGVAQSESSARALEKHARAVCKKKPSSECARLD